MTKIQRLQLLTLLFIHSFLSPIAAQYATSERIAFRHGNETLYKAFRENKEALEQIRTTILKHQSEITAGNGHIRIVSIIPQSEKGNSAAINLASIRGAVVRQWIKDNYPWLTDAHFAFFISPEQNLNAIDVLFMDTPVENKHQSDLFFSLDKYYPEKIDYAIARYQQVPFLDGSTLFEKTGISFKIVDPTLDPTPKTIFEKGIDERVLITIYYRWDKDNLDATYLTNMETLHKIDSLLNLKSADYIDSLRIVAYASPEGNPDYNQKLSERRASTLKSYILATYSGFSEQQIITEARGENWQEFRDMAEADDKLPMKEQVLSIINDPTINNLQRQDKIARLDGGRVYKNYILPNYYRYLRSGASMFVIYNPDMPIDIDYEPIEVIISEPELEPEPIIIPEIVPEVKKEPVFGYPVALRTNLLYDLMGAANLGVEVPFGVHKNWSWIADAAYSYWRTSSNRYAFQTLEYGTELRYWLDSRHKKKKYTGTHHAKPLKGWNIGGYGRYWQRYDVQWIDGYQGDASWSAGLTAGYAWPISKQLSLEASLGAGWFSTSEYRHYHQPEYDKNGKYHLMWQETGRWSGLTLTKVRFSLVWLIEYKKKGARK